MSLHFAIKGFWLKAAAGLALQNCLQPIFYKALSDFFYTTYLQAITFTDLTIYPLLVSIPVSS
jgi:hypothetical protein